MKATAALLSPRAFVALLIALRRPELARRLVLVSGGFHRDGFVRQGDEDPVAMVAPIRRAGSSAGGHG